MKTILTTLIVIAPLVQFAQKLPPEMYYSADGKIIHTGGIVQTEGFYNKNEIKTVHLAFSQPNFWTLLTNNYASETLLEATLVYDGITYPGVGVRFRGNTSYTQIGSSQKKSFAIETDLVSPDQKILGYNDLKFNNAHLDATFMREVLYARMASKYMPIAKGNYIRLFINNEDWGIYPNIQAIDKSFLREWFLSNDGARFRATVDGTSGPTQWGDGTAAMNYLGPNIATYQLYYSLKSNDIVIDPWQMLINACYALSVANANELTALKEKIDVDKALWFLACENIFTDEDGYVMKGKMDYMIYYEPETGRTTPLEYDGNSTFVVNLATSPTWGPFKNVSNVNYPLLNKLINIPELRQRYLAHYRTILNETFTTANANSLIDELNSQISSLVASDPKKLYSTTAYIQGIPTLKNFVTNRRNYLMANSEVAQVGPTISSAKFYNAANQENEAPLANQICHIKTAVASSSGIYKVYLYFGKGLVGNFTRVEMFDNGNHNDGISGDGVFGASIPGFPAGTLVRFYVEAISNNTAKSASYLPQGAEHDIFVYRVATVNSSLGVVINELVAQNTNGTKDEAGDFEDWIELYNLNEYPVNLGGFYLSDNMNNLTKWQFPPGSVIPAKGFMIIWADEEPNEGPLHASFKLAVGGESVTLSGPDQGLVDQVIFGQQQTNMGYARVPNGTGNFVIQPPTFNANNSPTTTVKPLPVRDFIIFPNPAKQEVRFSFPQDLQNEEMLIFNPLGQLVYSNISKEGMTINVGNLAPGIHVVRVKNIMKKLVVPR